MLLQALAATGKQGGTLKELKHLVQKREDACMQATSDTRISKLIGSSCTIQQELNKASPVVLNPLHSALLT